MSVFTDSGRSSIFDEIQDKETACFMLFIDFVILVLSVVNLC